jgi:hypothetical protein
MPASAPMLSHSDKSWPTLWLAPACVGTPLCVVSRIRAARRIGDHAQTVNVELIGGS